MTKVRKIEPKTKQVIDDRHNLKMAKYFMII